MDNWLIIVNPNANAGKCGRDWKLIESLLKEAGFSFQAVFTTRRLHAMVLARAGIAAGFRKLITVGGDGTLNEVINGIFAQKDVPTTGITIGMIPVGTGNDWARTFRIPNDYRQAISLIAQQNTLVQDAGLAVFQKNNKTSKRYFINIAGIGFDAMVTQRTNRLKEKGQGNKMVYLLNILLGLFSFKYFKADLDVDGTSFRHDIFSMSIGIGKYNGGGMMQLPNAIHDDGRFDLTIIRKIGRFEVIRSLPMLYNGKITRHPKVVALTGTKIKIDSPVPVQLETDGENLGHTPFSFEVVPLSLRVITGLKTA